MEVYGWKLVGNIEFLNSDDEIMKPEMIISAIISPDQNSTLNSKQITAVNGLV